MDFSRKKGESKKPINANRSQRGVPVPARSNSRTNTANNQTACQPKSYSSCFSQGQRIEGYTSNTKAIPYPKLPSSKENSNLFPYRFATHTRKVETLEEKKIRLLEKYESPFKWKPRQVKPIDTPETIINRMQDKNREVKDERKFKWKNFIFHLVISYELWRAKKLSQALEEICDLESLLRKPSNRGDFMFNTIENALWHVVTASKTFLYLEQKMVTQAEQLMETILPLHLMDRSNKAGIHGIKAAMFMEYGHRGNKNALDEARKAVEVDRTGAEWWYYISKCMGRIRRVAQCHEPVHFEEVLAINKAIKLDQENASYIVLLAQVLSERAFKEYKKEYPDRQSEQFLRIKKTYTAAMHKFKKAVELSPNSPHILIRSARGMMRLPFKLRDLKFTKECIDKALEFAPNNPMVVHVQAMYHERFDCDIDLPLEAYEKAASLDNFGAAMDLIRLHHKLKAGDIVKELEELASKIEQEDKLQVIYTQAGSYLLFIKKDIIGALNYYLKVIEINPNSYAMMSHKAIFFRMRDPVNMFDVMLEELKTKTDMKSFLPEEKKVITNFLAKAIDHQPLPNEVKKRPTVEEILDLSRKVSEREGLYKETRSAGRRRRAKLAQLRNKSSKKWRGKKKEITKENEVKSKENKKTYLNNEINKHKREDNRPTKFVEIKRSESVSSVDSDYHRDSTFYGPRHYFNPGSIENLFDKTKMTRSSNEDHRLYMPRESSVPRKFHCYSDRSSRDSSISSMPSVCSSVDIVSSHGSDIEYLPRNTTEESKLTVENVKKLDSENKYDSGVRRLSMLSLSRASSVSQASSSDTLTVMDRVKQSYAMLGRESYKSHRKKADFRKYDSTQSLNIEQPPGKWKNKDSGNRNTGRSGSSQSLKKFDENMDRKFSTNFKSRDFSNESSRSFSFMPDFARKHSQSDSDK